MSRCTTLLLIAAVAASGATLGCKKRPPPAPRPTQKGAKDAKVALAEGASPRQPVEGIPAAKKPAQGASNGADSPSEPESPTRPAMSREERDAARTRDLLSHDLAALQRELAPLERPTHGVVRMLVLAPQGPLIVELALAIDGEPYHEPMNRLVRQALRLADGNRDGKPTWDELLENPGFRNGQYGNVPIEPGQDEQFRRMYDANLDGIVDAKELPRVLTRNAGRAKPFYHRGSNFYYRANRVESPLRRILDLNRDGHITVEEARGGRSLLYARDVNEDEILQVNELLPAGSEERVPLLSRRMNNNPEPAVSLYDNVNWGNVHFAMREHYEGGYPLLRESFQSPASLFDLLDADRDDELSNDEVSQLASMAPHIRLRINFGAREGRPLVENAWLCDELKSEGGAAFAPADNRVVLTLPGVKLEFFANDAIGQNVAARADSELARLDQNRDGYLVKDELAEEEMILAAFDDFDQNGDEKLHIEELRGGFQLQASASAGQIRARTGYFSDALFSSLDRDHNNRLTPREIDGLLDQLASYDANNDGELSVMEIPNSMLVGFVRGDPQQDESLFQPSQSVRPATLSGPRWFRSMDRNGDNELTPAEFLGTSQQFGQLDNDRDGYISPQEAEGPSASPK